MTVWGSQLADRGIQRALQVIDRLLNLKKSVELKVIIGSVRIIGAKPWYYPQKLFTQKVTQN
jgi:hypothetical protein